MVERLLGLKLRLFVGSFRRSPIQIVGLVFALLYGLGTAVLVVAGLVALRFSDVAFARSAVVVFGALVLVIFAVLPLVLGIDDTLDPRKFTLFGIANGRLAWGLGVAALLSVPSIVITIMVAGTIVTWSRGAFPVVMAVVAGILTIATCVLSARITTSVAAFILSSRRARDLAGLAGLIVVVALVPLVAALASVNWQRDALGVLAGIERVVSWTPIGAVWAVPADAAAGDTAQAWLKLAIAVVWFALLALAWRVLLGIMLVSPVRQVPVKVYAGLGWFDRMPATPTWAIAARNLTYWARDARYGTALAIIPIIPAIMVVALHIAGLPLNLLALLPIPVASLFLSWAIHNDVSFDNTAIWLHLVSSTRGRADRWGRLIPVLLVGVPFVVIGSIVATWAFGDWVVLPSIAGVSTAILLAGLGLSSVMSAAFPYPAVRPGESPFSQPSGGGSPAGLIQALSFGFIILFALPAVAFAVLGFLVSPMWHIWSLVAGVVFGLIVLFGGVAIGSRVYDRRSPLLLDAALRN